MWAWSEVAIHTHWVSMKSYLCPRLTQDYKLCFYSSWSDPPLPDLGEQDCHHFKCRLVSQLPQVLLLHCVLLHPRWLHHCHPTCWQWSLPHSDIPPTWHHLQDWGGGCEEGRQSRWTEGKGHGELHYWGYRWVDNAANIDAVCGSFIQNVGMQVARCV